jgi:hypothetical protein
MCNNRRILIGPVSNVVWVVIDDQLDCRKVQNFKRTELGRISITSSCIWNEIAIRLASLATAPVGRCRGITVRSPGELGIWSKSVDLVRRESGHRIYRTAGELRGRLSQNGGDKAQESDGQHEGLREGIGRRETGSLRGCYAFLKGINTQGRKLDQSTVLDSTDGIDSDRREDNMAM